MIDKIIEFAPLVMSSFLLIYFLVILVFQKFSKSSIKIFGTEIQFSKEKEGFIEV